MSTSEKKFIEHVKKECEAYDVKLTITNGKSVQYTDNSRCSGWFLGGSKPELKVAGGNPFYVQILVHEFGHLHQWAENCDVWVASERAYEDLQEWFAGKKIRDVDGMLRKCMEVELDCEKRAVRMIKEWDLDINTSSYIQGANAYMYYWLYLKLVRRWSAPNKSPVHSSRVLERMPIKFQKEYKLTDQIIKMYDKVTGLRA